jgi:prophage antirepressor-like protein
MSNQLQKVFEYQGNDFRAVVVDSVPWFVAKDVCDVLGLEQVSRAMDRLEDDERRLVKVPHPQNPDKTIDVNGINESGLYQLIIASNKPEAKAFKRWITHEVLPDIRKHGGYLTPEKVEEVLLNPDTIIRLATDLKTERERRVQLEQVNAKLQPLANFAQQIQVSKNTILIRELAKIACKNGVIIGEKRLYAKLREWGLIFQGSTEPKQEYVDRGYFEVSEGSKESERGTFTYRTTRVTGKGQIYIINRLQEEKTEKAV